MATHQHGEAQQSDACAQRAAGGPYVVDEGGSVVLSVDHPSPRRGFSCSKILCSRILISAHRYVVGDYDDNKDDFDNFQYLDPAFSGYLVFTDRRVPGAGLLRWLRATGDEHSFGDCFDSRDAFR